MIWHGGEMHTNVKWAGIWRGLRCRSDIDGEVCRMVDELSVPFVHDFWKLRKIVREMKAEE